MKQTVYIIPGKLTIHRTTTISTGLTTWIVRDENMKVLARLYKQSDAAEYCRLQLMATWPQPEQQHPVHQQQQQLVANFI
jgi:hypothetical protein